MLSDGFLLSAAMAYYAAFSLFPLCLVLIAILGFVMQFSSQAQDAQRQLLDLVSQNGGPWLAEQLQGLLAGVKALVAEAAPPAPAPAAAAPRSTAPAAPAKPRVRPQPAEPNPFTYP